MTTFARLVNGYALDCRVHASATEMTACFHPDWLAANPFTVVPDGTIHGAKDNGNGTFTNPPAPPIDVPKPNNPGNPYWPKKILETKDFLALAGMVLGPRYVRLRNDPAFLWVYDVLITLTLVNTDDTSGQFIRIVDYLTTTNAADGQKLMSAQDVAAIMAAWKAP